MKKILQKEILYGAKNYSPINVCIKKAKGVYLTDIENNKYLDFISAYSAVNQGHCHPRLVKVIKKQCKNLTLTSRALYNNKLGDFMENICNTFNYEKVLPMNTGVEGGETAIKISRAWGYKVKNIEPNKAVNLFCRNNFWGRTLAAASSSTDPSCYNNFGPYMNGFDIIPFNCIKSLERKFIENPNIVSFMVEPIQGEAGIIIPDSKYLNNVKKLCEKYNVLMIADEVQTGLGRTGKMITCDYNNIKPDILILGKALSGGFLPLSAVLSDSNVMDVITPGTHGSTFGGNPLAASIGIESLNIIKDEKLCEKSFENGKYFRNELKNITKNKDFIKDIRGKGLLNAIEFKNREKTDKILNLLKENGLLAKSTHNTIIRLSPPLVITKKELNKSLEIINNSINEI